MIETILSYADKFIAGISWIIEKVRRPSIKLPEAPRNIFEYFGPGKSLEWMKEKLGAPYRHTAHQYGYKFSDALVQIESSDGHSITSIGVALPRLTRRARFPIYPHPSNATLGVATWADVFEDGMEIKKELSSKEYLTYIEANFGFPGHYNNFTFGLLQAPFIGGPHYQWVGDQQIAHPDKVRINWAGVSADTNHPCLYNYLLFM